MYICNYILLFYLFMYLFILKSNIATVSDNALLYGKQQVFYLFLLLLAKCMPLLHCGDQWTHKDSKT